MATEDTNPNKRKSKTVRGSLILMGLCSGAAILGIFVGVIVVYGGLQAL